MPRVLLVVVERIGPPILGVVLPAVIFGLSVALTLMLIRHFTKKGDEHYGDETP